MQNRKLSRLRRARKARAKIRQLGVVRLSVHKTNRHLYVQAVESTDQGDRVLAAVSTAQKDTGKKNIEGAAIIGRALAEKVKEKGITQVAFDRSGYQYHGRVKQIADAAREAGLEF